MIVVPHLQHKPIDVSEKKTIAANILSLNYQAEKADEQKREGGDVWNNEQKGKHVKKILKPLSGSKRETDLIIILSSFHFGSFIWNYNLQRAIISKWHPAWILLCDLIVSSLALTSAQWCDAHWKPAWAGAWKGSHAVI